LKRNKLVDKVRNNSRNVSLRDFEKLINNYGHVEEGTRHPKAIIGGSTMPYKRENPVKSCYVKELLAIIEEYSV
jgi:adenylosuccinate lyase